MNTTKDLRTVDGGSIETTKRVRPTTEGGRMRKRKNTMDPNSNPTMLINKESTMNNSNEEVEKIDDEENVTVNSSKFK